MVNWIVPFFFGMLRSFGSLSGSDSCDFADSWAVLRPSGRTIPSTTGGARLSRAVDWLLQMTMHNSLDKRRWLIISFSMRHVEVAFGISRKDVRRKQDARCARRDRRQEREEECGILVLVRWEMRKPRAAINFSFVLLISKMRRKDCSALYQPAPP